MSGDVSSNLRSVSPGALLALLAILFGFALGGAFGAAEDSIKGRLAASGEAALESAYGGDVAKKDAVVSKSWTYLKRAHLHGGAIGAAALASILLLALAGNGGLLDKLSSLAFGGGALVYAVFWLGAGLKAPGMGSTGAAKESLSYLAIPGTALCMVGLLGTIVVLARFMARRGRA